MTPDEKYRMAEKLSRALTDYLDGVGDYPMDYQRMSLAEYLVDEVLESDMQTLMDRIDALEALCFDYRAGIQPSEEAVIRSRQTRDAVFPIRHPRYQ